MVAGFGCVAAGTLDLMLSPDRLWFIPVCDGHALPDSSQCEFAECNVPHTSFIRTPMNATSVRVCIRHDEEQCMLLPLQRACILCTRKNASWKKKRNWRSKKWERQKCNQCAVVTTWWECFFSPLLLLLRYVGNCYCCLHTHRDRKTIVSSSISNREPNLLSSRELTEMRQRARECEKQTRKLKSE